MHIAQIDIRVINEILKQFNIVVNGNETVTDFIDTGVGYYLTIELDIATVVSLPETIGTPSVMGSIDGDLVTGYVCFVKGKLLTLECFTYDRTDFDYRSDNIELTVEKSG